jgi:predicted TPR repeat methyltransferase
LGETDAAFETLADGIAACPRTVSLRTAAMLQSVRRQDFTGALAIADRAHQDGVADACVYGLKGHSLSSLGRHDEAADAYADALKLGPGDPYVRHLASATGAIPPGERAPSDYLRIVFDGYAPYFEEHLLSLEYRVPGLIRAAVMRQCPAVPANDPVGPVLDLGCGTGMGAVALLECGVGPFIGVDLSPAMLGQAADKGLYAELHEADLLAFLQRDARRFPLVIAGDVLCYFGALEAVFASVHRRLVPGGLFVFSCEETERNPLDADAPPAAWSLGPQARYAHSHDYIVRCAHDAGFLIVEQSCEVLRREMGAAVMGCVMALERVQHDG